MISTVQSSSIVVADKPDSSDTIRGAGGDLTNATNVYDATSRRKEVYRWLSANIPSANYNAALAARLKDTCSWFLDGARFTQWKSEADILMWLHGSPGCGKTVLCASAIQAILRHCESDPTLACAYFFFDGRDSQKELQLHENLIRSLIRQLSDRLGGVSDPLITLYTRCHNGGSQPSMDALQSTLLEIVDSFKHVYIIIDSLDECSERKVLLNWIKEVADWKTSKLHLLVTSRNEEDIAQRLQSLDPNHVHMKPEYVNTDIEKFVDHMLRTEAGLEHWDDEIQANIKSTLLTSAEGMFRLVSLQIKELQDCYSQDALEEQMGSLPGGLDEFYHRIVSQIGKKHRAEALKVLRWLMFSARPLRLQEVAQVVGVVEDQEYGLSFKPSRVYRDPRLVLHVCSSLVSNVDGTIKLAHMSVKDYLLSQKHYGFGINEKTSHSFIGQTCLAYLLQFQSLDTLTSATIQNFPLADYAAQYWISHVQSGEDSIAQQNLVSALFQLQHFASFVTWVRLHDIDGTGERSLERSLNDIPTPLYYAALAGLVQVVQSLLDEGVDINARGGRYGNALQAASFKGHEDIVKLLVHSGASIDAQGGYYGTALQAASSQGYRMIAKLLLEKETNLNVQIGSYGNALQAAACQGHEEIVMLLLERGADVNAECGFYGNALQAASSQGHEMIVKLLIEKGAHVNAIGGNYSNALYAASDAGHEGIVKLLIENGADVNAQRGHYGNALYGASQGGYTGIALLLLEKEADVNTPGGFYGNALQAAAFGGHEAIVKLLLQKGADVNGREGHCGTELYGASHEGHKGIVGLLLEKGAAVNTQSGFYGNALCGASHGGHKEIVKLLLEKGAEVNAQDGYFGNALYGASHGGHKEIVKLLLENGADVNLQGGYYNNALQAASSQGNNDVVELLLEKGADVNIQGGYFANALQAAAAHGHETVVKALLKSGADVNAKGGYYGTALDGALAQCQVEVVKLLQPSGEGEGGDDNVPQSGSEEDGDGDGDGE